MSNGNRAGLLAGHLNNDRALYYIHETIPYESAASALNIFYDLSTNQGQSKYKSINLLIKTLI